MLHDFIEKNRCEIEKKAYEIWVGRQALFLPDDPVGNWDRAIMAILKYKIGQDMWTNVRIRLLHDSQHVAIAVNQLVEDMDQYYFDGVKYDNNA